MKLVDIKKGEGVETFLCDILSQIFKNGPIDNIYLEALSYISIFQNDILQKYIDDINLYCGLFYKHTERISSLQAQVQKLFQDCIKDKYGSNLTPVQANILSESEDVRCFSFSAPTSTGKSHTFFTLVNSAQKDVVIIVPSRALINEYYVRLCNEIQDKSVNILTYVDCINKKHRKRSILILTPERCKDLFRLKNLFSIELIIFDEAQLSDEKGKRGMYFDAIVRRCNRELPYSKLLFAHPFISNPEAQITKNSLPQTESSSKVYNQRNVGQIFMCQNNNNTFSYFGSDSVFWGTQKLNCDSDPIEDCINRNGSVLFYVSKNSILNNNIFNSFQKYINLCQEINNPNIQQYIDELKSFTGGETIAHMNYYSKLLTLLKRGIVIHHGSLPLKARILIEKFTREGFCKLCFATSTLEQGINMPFDIVYIDKLESSNHLSVKNLIGRAGRSSILNKIDYGIVIIASSKVSKIRKILSKDISLNNVSQLDDPNIIDDDYKEFKDAILNNTFSDQFNLTENQLVKMSDNQLDVVIKAILDSYFTLDEGKIDNFPFIINSFRLLYEHYLGRMLSEGERGVFKTAISILLQKMLGRTFSYICQSRYAYISKQKERATLSKQGKNSDSLFAQFSFRYIELPNNKLTKSIPLFAKGTKAKDVDYDIVTYDTYDYLDKIIGLYFVDIFYAGFVKYNERNPDTRAEKMALLIKYGTYNERQIMMLRYGMSFEDIEVLDKYIISIDEDGIVVNEEFYNLPEQMKTCIERYV